MQSRSNSVSGWRKGSEMPARVRHQEKDSRREAGSRRVLIFASLLHVWPLLLLLSQKALTPLGLLLAGGGTRQYRRDMVVAVGMILFAGLTLLLQQPNDYATAHFFGYVLFVLSVPLINAAAHADRQQLLKNLALLSIFNSVLAYIVYFLSIDLSAFRGLNRIIGDDDATHRVYYETASLLAVFTAQFIRNKPIRWLCIIIVAGYALFLGKSVFVVILFLLNRYIHLGLRGSVLQRLAFILLLLIAAIVGPIITLALRSDIGLSLGIKLLQFQEILEDTSPVLMGSGWGYVIDAIVNNMEQEYQVEMQLPMLLRQIGWGGVLVYVVGMFLLIRSVSANLGCAVLRWLTYLAIGFNNPWLLIPSWYMTTCLMYLQLDRKKS